MINILSSSRYRIERKILKNHIESILKDEQLINNKNINIVFVGKNKMRSISSKYKNENVALPVLSFLYNTENLLGEVFICYPQAVLLAAEREKKVNNILIQLIEHGINNLLK